MTKGTYDTNIVKKTIGSRLQKARQGKEYSRQVVVDLLNAHTNAPSFKARKILQVETYKKWETAENSIQIEWIPAICEVLDCDVGYLFGEYEERHRTSADISAETGLTESAIQKLHNMRCKNQIDWLTDILNSIVEHEDFDALLVYALDYALSGDSTATVTQRGYPLKVECKDIYRMKILDVLGKILSSASERFEGRADYRHWYGFYYSLYVDLENRGFHYSLDDMRTMMEEFGLEFDPLLFEGGRENG